MANDVLQRIMQILIEDFVLEEEDIKPEARLIDDLGLEEIEHVELMMILQVEFGIRAISYIAAEKITTVEGAARYVMAHLPKNNRAA